MIACQMIAKIVAVNLKSGISKEKQIPYRIWSLSILDKEAGTVGVIGINDEVATKMGLETNPDQIVDQTLKVTCAVSFKQVGYNSIPRIDAVKFEPVEKAK